MYSLWILGGILLKIRLQIEPIESVKNTVMVHPIIVNNSIEEKILELQNRKRALSRSVIEDGAAAIELTKDDLLGLFLNSI